MDLTSVLKRPIITEKSTALKGEGGRYCFQVDRAATKIEIKLSVEKFFGVKVKDVKTTTVPAQKRRVGRLRKEIKIAKWKKAVVELEKGQKIDTFETGK